MIMRKNKESNFYKMLPFFTGVRYMIELHLMKEALSESLMVLLMELLSN